MPVRVCTGFEFGLSDATSLTKGNTGRKLFDAISGSPTMASTGAIRNGSYALELNPSASIEYVSWNTTGGTIPASQTRAVLAFAFQFPTSLPAADTQIAAMDSNTSCRLFFRNSDGKLVASAADNIANGQASANAIVADTWYYVELYADVSALPHTLDWWIDGVQQTQDNEGASASTISAITLGTGSSQTMTCRFDDVVVDTHTAAITTPYGQHKVVLLKPDTGGTAVEIGTANATGRMVTNSAIDATFNSANILAATSEVPPLIGASATGVGQRTSGTGNACGIPMTTYTLAAGETITGVRLLICGWSGTATTNNLGVRYYNGTAETIWFASANPDFDNNTTSPGWLASMTTVGDFDTQAELDAMVVRLGYSADISPLPGAHAIYAEVAVKEVSVPTLVIADATHSHTADGPLALTQVHVLAVADATHGHTVDNVVLTLPATNLVIADSTHGQTVDNVILETGATNLVIADATHGHTVDGPLTLAQQHNLIVADSTHGHTVDGLLVLGQVHVLAIADSTHSHQADVITLLGDALYIRIGNGVLIVFLPSDLAEPGLHGQVSSGGAIESLGINESTQYQGWRARHVDESVAFYVYE